MVTRTLGLLTAGILTTALTGCGTSTPSATGGSSAGSKSNQGLTELTNQMILPGSEFPDVPGGRVASDGGGVITAEADGSGSGCRLADKVRKGDQVAFVTAGGPDTPMTYTLQVARLATKIDVPSQDKCESYGGSSVELPGLPAGAIGHAYMEGDKVEHCSAMGLVRGVLVYARIYDRGRGMPANAKDEVVAIFNKQAALLNSA